MPVIVHWIVVRCWIAVVWPHNIPPSYVINVTVTVIVYTVIRSLVRIHPDIVRQIRMAIIDTRVDNSDYRAFTGARFTAVKCAISICVE